MRLKLMLLLVMLLLGILLRVRLLREMLVRLVPLRLVMLLTYGTAYRSAARNSNQAGDTGAYACAGFYASAASQAVTY